MNGIKNFLTQNQDIEHRVLLIGKTGSGKSTFINTIANYFLGGALQNLKIVIPTKNHVQNEMTHIKPTENNTGNPGMSQTNSTALYKFNRRGEKYAFIDTPGFADTRGPDQDEQNIQNILDTVIQQQSLTSVIIIMNGTESRMTDEIKLVINCLKSNLPNDLFENTLLVFTNCDEVNFQDINALDIPGIDQQDKRYFRMNNSAFGNEFSKLSDRQQKNRIGQWEESFEEIEKILDVLKKMHPKDTNSFAEISKARETINASVHEIVKFIIDSLKVKKILDEKRGSVENIGSEKIKRLEFVPSYPELNLICGACNKVCTRDCLIGTKFFCQSITAITRKCKVCKCKADRHYHACLLLDEKERTIEYLLQEMQEEDMSKIMVHRKHKLHQKDEQQDKVSSLKKNMVELSSSENRIQLIDKSINDKVGAIRDVVIKVKEICKGFDLNEIDKKLKKVEEASKEIINKERIRLEFDTKMRNLKEKLDDIKKEYKPSEENAIKNKPLSIKVN